MANENELASAEERIDRIVEEGKAMLENYEKELSQHFAGSEEGSYEEEYLSLFKQAQQNILAGTQQLLEKEVESTVAKIQSSDPEV